MIITCLFITIFISSVIGSPKEVCYKHVGCFNNKGDFRKSIQRPKIVLPQSPQFINVTFRLFSRTQPSDGVELKARDTQRLRMANVNGTLPFKIVVHGFRGKSASKWMTQIQRAFLSKVDVNVITVIWIDGAQFPYWQAVANTRIVGAEIAALIRLLKKELPGFEEANVHLIGHSLGAHISGYAGSYFTDRKIGRITGMDTAGPYFRHTKPSVRLDPSDAIFVDAIHTNNVLGMRDRVAHSDFYVNGGYTQPGCHITKSTISKAVRDLFKGKIKGLKMNFKKFICSHKVAPYLFEYTIASDEQLVAFKCANYKTFLKGRCLKCTNEGDCIKFGVNAKKQIDGGKYFLQTGVMPNFSGTHFGVKFFISRQASKKTGRFYLTFNYKSGTSSRQLALPSAKKWFKIASGKILENLQFLEGRMQEVRSITISWRRHRSVTNMFSWLGNGSTRIDKIEFFNASTQTKTSFCGGFKMKSKRKYTMFLCQT